MCRKDEKNMKLFEMFVSVLIAGTLAGCGGGGGGGGDSPVEPIVSLAVNGTAATGKAIAGAPVSAKCQTGSGAASTDVNGAFRIVINGGKLPCFLEIANPVDGTKLHTIATGADNAATANITPLTEMLSARVLRNDPVNFFAMFNGSAGSVFTTAGIKAAQADVESAFKDIVDLSTVPDFLTSPLVAATANNPTAGNQQDKLLDALKLKINSAQLTQVVSALAHTTSVNEVRQFVSSLTATPPLANAGSAQNIIIGSAVTLDGSGSSVATGQSLTYAWVLTARPAGSAAVLSSASSAKPEFVADVAGTYIATLIVNDGKINSAAAAVTITASVANASPVANAGPGQNVQVGRGVTLDGSASADANNDPLTFSWELTAKPAGSSAILFSSTTVRPNFTADREGIYVARLIVSDGKASSEAVTVTITASILNAVPVANAGLTQSVKTGASVRLNGSASSDADGDALSFSWTLTTRPAGSTATLLFATNATPSFIPDVVGVYVASLVVNDGKISSNPSTVTVIASRALNSQPVANAGPAQNVMTGTQVKLNGEQSSDADGDALTYLWSMKTQPAGSAAQLTDATSSRPGFTADKDGAYVISLKVNDGIVGSSENSVTVTAASGNSAPVANPGPNISVLNNTRVTLDGRGSSDANGDPLTYLWKVVAWPSSLSNSTFENMTTATPSFVPDVLGTYVLSLVVNDGKTDSAAVRVTVTAAESLPIQTVPGKPVLLVQDRMNLKIINESTMTTTIASTCATELHAMDLRADGVIVGVGSWLVEINPVTGACVRQGSPRGIDDMIAFAVSPSGQYWAAGTNGTTNASQIFYKLDADGKLIMPINRFVTGAVRYILGMDFLPNGDLIGFGRLGVDKYALVKIEPESGVTTLIANLTEAPDNDIDVDENGLIRGLRNGEMLYISSSTGAIVKRAKIASINQTVGAPIVILK